MIAHYTSRIEPLAHKHHAGVSRIPTRRRPPHRYDIINCVIAKYQSLSIHYEKNSQVLGAIFKTTYALERVAAVYQIPTSYFPLPRITPTLLADATGDFSQAGSR
jgi:hypothetical protein